MGAPGVGAERSRRAFDRAVARERDAIALHERAAVLHEGVADVLERAAARQASGARTGVLRERAEAERRLAGTARERARTVRARLTGEGVEPARDQPPAVLGR
ncbi:hypothetical protein ACI784_21915 [Geodermatophilus sp. SYSU D01186]